MVRLVFILVLVTMSCVTPKKRIETSILQTKSKTESFIFIEKVIPETRNEINFKVIDSAGKITPTTIVTGSGNNKTSVIVDAIGNVKVISNCDSALQAYIKQTSDQKETRDEKVVKEKTLKIIPLWAYVSVFFNVGLLVLIIKYFYAK